MIVYVETPEQRRARLAKRAKKATAKARKRIRAVEQMTRPKKRTILKPRYGWVEPGGDWWNDLAGDSEC
jgi:hypothetical protein